MTRYRRHTGLTALTTTALMIVAAVAWTSPAIAQKATRTEHDLLGDKAGSRRRLLRRPDAARAGELPALRSRHQPLSRLRRGVGHRQAGGGARQHRRRRDEAGAPGRASRRPAKAVMDGKYHDQFLVDWYQGGAGTSTNMNANEVLANVGARADGPQEGRVPVSRAARRPEHVAVDQRLLPDGDQGRAHPAQRQADRRARAARRRRSARRATRT